MIVFVFFFLFILLAWGASGTIPAYRDSGDLIASLHSLGIAHPPGYAAYVISGKLFHSLVPFGNAAYKTNLFSAFWGALAGAGFFHLLRKRISPAAAVLLTLLLISAPAFIMLSRVSEMYTMALAWAVLILMVTDSEQERASDLAAFLLGIGMTIHPTLLSLLPVLVGSAVRRGGGVVQTPIRRYALTPTLYFLLGFSICLYLPIRALQEPVQNWGDPSNWRQFWRVLTRADYGGLKLHPEQSVLAWTPAGVVHQWVYFARALMREWGLLAMVLAIGGMVWSIRTPAQRSWGIFLTLSFFIAGPVFFLVSNLPLNEATTPAILQPYLLIPGLLLILLMVSWITPTAALTRRPQTSGVVDLSPEGRGVFQEAPLPSGDGRSATNPADPSVVWRGSTRQDVMARRVRVAVLVPMAAGVALLMTAPWKSLSVSDRHNYLAYDYGRNLLRSLPAHAVLYEPDDPTAFTLRVLQLTENRRPDVIPLNFFRTRWGYEDIRRRWPDLLPPVAIENGLELQRALWGYSAMRRPFYSELPQKLEGRPYRTEGLVYRFEGKQSADLWPLYVRRGENGYPDFFSQHLVDYYAAAHCNLGLDYATAGQLERAIFHYQSALVINPSLAAAWNNWGNLEYSRGRFNEALALYDAGLRRVPGDSGLMANRTLVLR